jgi:hypothetical protein
MLSNVGGGITTFFSDWSFELNNKAIQYLYIKV